MGCSRKVRYRSRKYAARAASDVARASGEPVEAYHCHVHHCWHTGHPVGWRRARDDARWYDLGPGPTSTLLALVSLVPFGPTVTFRDIASYTGRALGAVYDDLLALHRAGLVAWESGTAGTLRPLVEEVAA